MATTTLDRWEMARYAAYRWRYERTTVQKVTLALGMACVTGLLAQLRIQLPFTPVPITGQTFAVLMAGILLGGWWGGLSQVLYAGLGAAGVPWFNGWQGGISQLAGPTGGYIIGFILAAMFVGHFTDRYISARRLYSLLGLMLFGNFVLVYVPGMLQLGLWLNLIQGKAVSVYQVLVMGFFPFIIGDVIKVAVAAGIAWGVTTKRSFNTESDASR